jgi:hypothetical protein
MESEYFYDSSLKTIEELNILKDKLLKNTFRLKMVCK